MSLEEKHKERTELKVDPQEESADGSSRDELAEASQNELAGASRNELPDFGPNYEPLEIIGSGGMGAVYKVKEGATGAIYAIKLLQAEFTKDATAVKRFEQEANAAKQLDHPNLVSVYEHGKTVDGAPYLVMEYFDGRSLASILKEEGRLEPKRALDIFIQIAEGLSHAHEKGVIHRDVKPTNVILTKSYDGAEIAHIVDFGIARALPSESRETRDLTQTGEVFGSPYYMSPEQCLGFLVDERSDIYSFGCLMYETISGAPPFTGSNPVQVVVQHINENPPSFVRDLKTNKLIKQLESVILKCLDKEQGKRFQTIEQLKTDLEALRDGNKIPRYENKRAKPTMTGEQLVGAFCVLFIGCVHLIYVSLTMGFYDSFLKTANICMLIAGVTGSYIFFKEGRNRLSNAFRHKETPGRWWIAIGMLSIAIAIIGQTPGMVKNILMKPYAEAPYWADALGVLGTSIYVVCIFLLGISIIAYLITRTARRVGPPFIIFCIAILSTVVLFAATRKMPDVVANVPLTIAEGATNNYPELAAHLYRLAVKLVPQSSDIWQRLAEVHVRLNQVDDAIESMKKADEARRRKEKEERKDREDKEDKNKDDKDDKDKDDDNDDEKESADSLVARAELNLQVPRFDKALEDIKTLHEEYPKDSRGYVLAGRYNAKQGRFDEALGDFDRADKLNPGSLEIRDRKIDVYLARREYEKAVQELDQIMSTQSGKTSARDLLRGIVLEKLNRIDEAKESFNDVRKSLSAYIAEPTKNHQLENEQSGEKICSNFVSIAYSYKRSGEDDNANEFLTYASKSAHRVLEERRRYRGMSHVQSMRKFLADALMLEAAASLVDWPGDDVVVE